jgi:hypothetical protein
MVIETPTNAIDAITTNVGDFIVDISPLLFMIMGIPLAFYVIDKIIKSLPKK